MSTGLRVNVLPSIADIPAAAWDACANPGGGENSSTFPHNPFISHAFLSSLEVSNSATARTGWAPQHLAAQDERGQVLGVAPCYLKSHSRGEYVFDRGWAEAFERAGGDYYPKLQVSVPFTPATGRRLLVRAGPAQPRGRGGAGARPGRAHPAARSLLGRTSPSCPSASGTSSPSAASCKRTDQQFHWENAGYASFDDFLGALAARKRKVIRRERRDALANGIEIEWLTGSRPHRSAVGRVLRASTSRPARANGAGRISPASSTRSSARRWRTASCW